MMQVGDKLCIRAGSVDLRLRENEYVALRNFAAGRPLDEGLLPSRYIPDPNGLPEWITVEIVP